MSYGKWNLKIRVRCHIKRATGFENMVIIFKLLFLLYLEEYCNNLEMFVDEDGNNNNNNNNPFVGVHKTISLHCKRLCIAEIGRAHVW
jgi:hypothetical protein